MAAFPAVSVAGLLLLEGSQFGGSEAGGVSPETHFFQGVKMCLFYTPWKKKREWLEHYQFFIGDIDTSSFCWLVFHCLLFWRGTGDWMLFWFGPPKNGGRVFSSKFLAPGHFVKLKRKSPCQISQFHQSLKKLPKQTIITIR